MGRPSQKRTCIPRRRAIAFAVVSLAMSLLLALPCWLDTAQAQPQLISEQNIIDAILERRQFEPIELKALDLNRDGVVDVADLTFHILRNAHLVPSVSFESHTATISEADGVVFLPLAFTKAFEAPATITYTLNGTATYGSASAGGDYMIAGYNPTTGEGTVSLGTGETAAYLEVAICDDTLLGEDMETVQLTLAGGSAQTYYLGAMQSHILYIDDNDGIWTAGLDLPEGSGYLSFDIEMIQKDGAFSGRLLADNSLVPMPEEDDPNCSGDDGWVADIFASTDAIRVEIGPIPVAPSLSFFQVHYSRYFILEAKPGQANYAFDPKRVFAGSATQILEPVRSRLGPVWQERSYLRREATGTFVMMRHTTDVVTEEVSLVDAE